MEDNEEQRKFLESFGSLKLILGVLLFFSLCLTILGWVAFGETHFSIFLWVSLFSMFLNMIYFLGIISIFKVEQDLQSVYYTNLTGSTGFEMLFIFFKISAFIMLMLMSLGIACFLCLEPAQAQLESLYGSKKDWEKIYGSDFPLKSAKELCAAFFYIVGVVCLLNSLLLLVVFYRGISIGSTQFSNRITAYFMAFNSVLIPIIVLVFIFLVLKGNDLVKTLPIIGDKFLPPFAISSFVALSVVVLALCFLGYIGGALESKTSLEAYGFLLAVAAIIMIIYGGLLTFYSNVFESYYMINWGDLMVFMDEQHFTPDYLGCYGGKYANH